jgi:hypothetical protein
MSADLVRGERALFVSPTGAYQDYLVNYLATTAEVRAFNAGGDKNSAIAMLAWPPQVIALARDPTPDTLDAALRSGVGVVVLPYFDLRAATYVWPPPPADRAAAQRKFAPILADGRHEVRRHRWFATVRASD